MKARLGIAPIAWSNDDLPELGGDTPLEVCLSESREAGFSGTETGGKFPKTPRELKEVLAAHDLKLVSGWYSGRVLENELSAEKDRAHAQLELFRENGASVLVYGETTGTVQNKRDVPLAKRPRLDDEQMRAYGRKLTAFAEHCYDQKVPLSFHHHMATAIETENDVDRLMNFTGEAVGAAVRHRPHHLRRRRRACAWQSGTASASTTCTPRTSARPCSQDRLPSASLPRRGAARRLHRARRRHDRLQGGGARCSPRSTTRAGSWSRRSRTRRRRTR